MDLRHMRHFVAVAEERHFGRAATRLNIQQPPLSQSIRRLEASLGFDLLDRTRRHVELTAAGRVFLEEARRTLLQAELARKMAERVANKDVVVPVSFVGPALYQILPKLIVLFRLARSDVDIRLFERTSSEQMIGLAAGDFEIGFTTTAIGEAPDCETMIVERAPFVAAVPADWPLAQRESVTLKELASHPFISSPSKYRGTVTDAFGMFKSAGVMPRIVQETSQTYTTLSLVSASLGCSLITATAAFVLPNNVRLLPIVDDVVYSYWQLLMVWQPRQLSPAAREFIGMARDHIERNPHLVAEQTPLEALTGAHPQPAISGKLEG